MTRTTWTPSLDARLREMFPTTASQSLADAIGCSVGSLRQRATYLGLRKSPEWRAQNARETTLARSQWAPELLEILDLMYFDQRTQDLADFIGIPLARVHAMANARGLRKSPELVRQMARDRLTPEHGASLHQFKKGQPPWNAGRKGINYPGMQATQFKSGRRPHTWLPIGSYRISGDDQLERKVNDLPGANHVRWHPVTRLVWQAAHGPVPQGYLVVFRPGTKTTVLEQITLDKLECISHTEHMRRNSLHTTLPPELRQLVQLRGALTRQINKQQRATRPQTQELTA